MTQIEAWVEQLYRTGDAPDEALAALIENEAAAAPLAAAADSRRREWFGTDVYLRGLIEFTNYCKNNCYYCGIRCGNAKAERYRLTLEQILDCCAQGWELGYRTFVLQGGEDPYFTDERMCEIIRSIRSAYPECAITLSIGEKSRESYAAYKAAGADRYLLRHETANPEHYRQLHPANMSGEYRKQCLYTLKELGFQVGAGMMVGAPGQTTAHLVEDLRFLQQLKPHMVGIGPFLTHRDTPFRDQPNGSFEKTVRLLSIVRLMMPSVLLPATTALGTIHPEGREIGLKAGANVIMPNTSPREARERYNLYENKAGADQEARQARVTLERMAQRAGYQVVTARGDAPSHHKS